MAGLDLEDVLSADDFQARAKRNLDKPLYEYFASGTDDEQTLSENRAAFKRVLLMPRCMRPVDKCDTTVTMLGATYSMPVFVTPAGVHKLADREGGEGATARACERASVACGVSQHATTSIEDVAAAAGRANHLWYQCYILLDRGITADLVRRAAGAGYGAIVVTVDSVVLGSREADSRNGFRGLPSDLSLVNYQPYARDHVSHFDDRVESAWDQNTEKLFDRRLSWADVTWLKSLTTLPLIVKGVLRADDAIAAIDAGADGIIVSNHGGRQLDGCPGAFDALPAVAAAVSRHRTLHGVSGGEVKWPVMLDGGVRRGTDVVKALASGAAAVLLGKPVFFALAVAGEAGVSHLLAILRRELAAAMALCGANDLAELQAIPDLAVRPAYGPTLLRAAL